MKNPKLVSYLMVNIKCFSSKIINKAWLSILIILSNNLLEILAKAIRKEKEVKGEKVYRLERKR